MSSLLIKACPDNDVPPLLHGVPAPHTRKRSAYAGTVQPFLACGAVAS